MVKAVRLLLATIPKIEEIHKEVRPNSGLSLRDSVNRVEAHMIRSDERQRVLMNDDTRGIVELSSDGLVLWANRAMVAKTRRPTSDLLGNGWIGLLDEQDASRISGLWELATRQGRELATDVSFITQDGEPSRAHMTMHVMRDAHGIPIGYIGVFDFGESDLRSLLA